MAKPEQIDNSVFSRVVSFLRGERSWHRYLDIKGEIEYAIWGDKVYARSWRVPTEFVMQLDKALEELVEEMALEREMPDGDKKESARYFWIGRR